MFIHLWGYVLPKLLYYWGLFFSSLLGVNEPNKRNGGHGGFALVLREGPQLPAAPLLMPTNG